MDTEKTEEVYKYDTKSVDELAVALALGAEVTKVDRSTGERFFTFSLKGNFDLEKTMLAFASKTLKIEAYSLCEAMRRSKSIIHSNPKP